VRILPRQKDVAPELERQQAPDPVRGVFQAAAVALQQGLQRRQVQVARQQPIRGAQMFQQRFDLFATDDLIRFVATPNSNPEGRPYGLYTTLEQLPPQQREELTDILFNEYRPELIKRMVADLNMDLEIIGMPTTREADGLAMSSRNMYLTPEEMEEAVILSRSLSQAKRMIIEEGIADAATLKQFIRGEIEKTKHGHIDYVEIVSMESLEGMNMVKKGETLIALAARFGKTRLIDNIRY
jgi:hypothetical protein